jgi:hypothetical protein
VRAAETNAEVIARIARDREPVDLTMDDAARGSRRRAALSLIYVVDCSLVVDALAAREADEVLRQRLSAPRTLHAPHPLDVEVASTVRGLAAGKKITADRRRQAKERRRAPRGSDRFALG